MHAKKGDRLVIKSNRVGTPERRAKILEVRGDHGGPPYLVEWSDDAHQALVYPGPDAVVEPKPR